MPQFSPVSSMMTRSEKIQTISRKWKDIAKLGLVPTMRSDDDYWKAEDSSLEHQVTITILSTAASNETENAHFLVSHHQRHGAQASDGNAASILSDLATSEEQLNSPRYSRSRRRLASTRRHKRAQPTNLPVHVQDEGTSRDPRTSLDPPIEQHKSVAPPTVDNETDEDRIRSKMSTRSIQFVDSFDPLALNEEPLPQFGLIDSFDSLSWGPLEDTEKGTTTISSDSDSSSGPLPKKMVRNKTEIDRNGFPKLVD